VARVVGLTARGAVVPVVAVIATIVEALDAIGLGV
jgi:hypothetical protein